MKIISVINYKGGVGKTTTTANVAGQLAWTGKNVLLVDLDPQASLTFSLVRPEDWESKLSEKRTIKRWFDAAIVGEEAAMDELLYEKMRVNEVLKGRGRLALIPSHLGLINVDMELAVLLGARTMIELKRNYVKVHQRLARGLAEIDSEAFDYVFIDCPPNFNIVTKTAIVASDHVLIPAKPDYLSTLGIDYLQRNLKGLVKEYNEFATLTSGGDVAEIDPEILGVLFTMVQFRSEQPISAHRTPINQVKDLEDVPVFKNYIRENKTAFGEAPQNQLPVALTHYTSRTHSNIVEELEAVAKEFESKLGGHR